MEDILRKALDEAFTAKWAAELDECDDMSAYFAPVFDLEMKKTIKKANHPVLFYTNYIAAAAACAVVALGVALIMPALTSGKIDAENTTYSYVSEPAPVNIVDDDISDITVLPASTGTVDTDTPAADDTADELPLTEETSVTSETTAPVPDSGNIAVIPSHEDEEIAADDEDDCENVSGEVAVPSENIPAASDTSIYYEPNDYGPTASDEDWPDITPSDTTDKAYDDADDVVAADDDDDAGVDDADITTDSDDDAITESDDDISNIGGGVIIPPLDDDDSNPATGGGDIFDGDDSDIDADDDADDIPVIGPSAGKNPYPDAETLGGLFKTVSTGLDYSALNVHSGSLVTGGKSNALYAGGAYLNEFIRASENAAFLSRQSTPTASYITLNIYDCPVSTSNIVMINSSQWLNYNSIYFNGVILDDSMYDDDYDYDVEDNDYTFSASLYIYKNGVISVENMNAFSASDSKAYKDKMYFKADPAAAAKLFECAEKSTLPASLTTVGSLISSMNITADNIKDAKINIEGIYDSWIGNMKVSGSAVEELFSSNSSQRIVSMSSSGRFAFCWFDLADCGARLRLSVTSDKCIVRSFDGREIAFPITRESFERFISSASAYNGLNIPIYRTLADFTADKNFTVLENAYARNNDIRYRIPAGEETEALFDAMKNELPAAEYCVSKFTRNMTQYVCLDMRDWGYNIMIFSDDTVQIGWNVFQATSGFYNRMKKLITESPNVSAEYINRASPYGQDVYFDEYDDDDDTEYNPIME